jgi:hypothetical protein
VLTAADGEIRQRRPAVYQEANGKRTEIAASYKLAGNGEVSLEVGTYDAHRALTIDPLLEYGTFIGAGIPFVSGLKVDSSGGAFLNSDMTPNLSPNPAAPGSIVALYATGGGQMVQSLADGRLVTQLVAPLASVAVTIDGQPADLEYAGAAHCWWRGCCRSMW